MKFNLFIYFSVFILLDGAQKIDDKEFEYMENVEFVK